MHTWEAGQAGICRDRSGSELAGRQGSDILFVAGRKAWNGDRWQYGFARADPAKGMPRKAESGSWASGRDISCLLRVLALC
jgi:hypothetical protein